MLFPDNWWCPCLLPMFLYPRLHGSVHKIELQNKRKCLSQQFVLASAKFSHQGSGQSRRVHFPQGKPWGAVLRCGWENLVFAPCAGLCGLWVSLCGLNRWVFVGCTHRKDQTVCTRSKEPRRNPSILSYNHHPVFSRAKWSKEADQICGVPLGVSLYKHSILIVYEWQKSTEVPNFTSIQIHHNKQKVQYQKQHKIMIRKTRKPGRQRKTDFPTPLCLKL